MDTAGNELYLDWLRDQGPGARKMGFAVSPRPDLGSGLYVLPYHQLGWPDRPGFLTPPKGAVPCGALRDPWETSEIRWAVWAVAIDDHPTGCSVALPGIWTWPNNGMILWPLEERYSLSCGALALSDP